MMKNAVVLLSGGLDSATVLAMARAQGFACYALSVDYGQRHHAELAAAQRVAVVDRSHRGIAKITGAERLSWLLGYETLCLLLADDRALLRAVRDRLIQLHEAICRVFLSFRRVRVVWVGDDMGYRGGTLLAPDDMRELVLPGHRRLAEIAHRAGRPYVLHSCGNLSAIMEDLIRDVGIDAKHSFEDTIESVIDAKARYGDRIAILGGIDVDFLCRADEKQVRERVRWTLERCMPGGGYCLGSGNSIANYVPLAKYLAMLDAIRRFVGG